MSGLFEKRTVAVGQYASGELIELEIDTEQLIREMMGRR